MLGKEMSITILDQIFTFHFVVHYWYLYCRYNGGEGYVPGAMFRKFDKRQATVYVKNVSH